MKFKNLVGVLAMFSLLAALTDRAAAQGTAFTYEGRLNVDSNAANGNYDLQGTMFADAVAPLQTGASITNFAVGVTNGVFTLTLDFGSNIFYGDPRWLEIGVRTNGSAGGFTILSPRQLLTPTPYAIYAGNAASATLAATANSVSSNAVSGGGIQNNTITAVKLAGGQVVKTLNGLADNISLSAGTNVTLTTNGNSLQISSPGVSLTNYVVKTGDTMTGSLNLALPAVLSFGNNIRQMINLWDVSYGIGVQDFTYYQRTGSGFAWYRGGSFTNTQNSPGSGGVTLMTLDSSGNLTASGAASFNGTASGYGVSATGNLGGLHGVATSGYGAKGEATTGIGLWGSSSSSGNGVYGSSVDGYGVQASSGTSYGLYAAGGFGGVNAVATTGYGVKAEATTGIGAWGTSSSSGDGVYGTSSSGAGVRAASTSGPGVSGTSVGGSGVYGSTSSSAGTSAGVWGDNATSGGTGVVGKSTAATGTGVFGGSAGGGTGVSGSSINGYGVYGTSTGGTGVSGSSSSGFGVHGISSTSFGVYGEGSGAGVSGVYGISYSTTGSGVMGENYASGGAFGASGAGVTGITHDNSVTTSVVGVHGVSLSGNSYAGWFDGAVEITTDLFVGGAKDFRIDHPLDPANKYLLHACIESPDVKNLYDGNVTTDASGEAIVTLPTYFEALNRDFRYQLTVIGQFAQAIVSSEIKSNQFAIKTDKPDVKVSWQVTGIRQDAYMKAHPIVVEQDKPTSERGTYQHPELFDQPEEKSLAWARNPELWKRLKEERLQRESSGKTGGQ